MTQNSFWTEFLRPLKDTCNESSEKYDPGFKKRLKRKPELILKKDENEDSRCLSRMILGQLQVQTEQIEQRKKRKAVECEEQLSEFIVADESETQSRNSSQSAVTPSTSTVRHGDSVTAKNKANPRTTIQQGLFKYGFGKVNDGGNTTSAIYQENQEILTQRELHKENFNEVNDRGNNPPTINQTNPEIMDEGELNKHNFKEDSDSGNIPPKNGNIPRAIKQTNPEIMDDGEINKQNYKEVSDRPSSNIPPKYGNIPPAINQTNPEIMDEGEINRHNFKEVSDGDIVPPAMNQTNPEITKKGEFNKQDFKEAIDVIVLANGEIGDDVNSAKELDTKRFKNAEVNSAMQTDIIADRRAEYPNNDEDTKDESSRGPVKKGVKKVEGLCNEKAKIDKEKSDQQRCVSKWNLKCLQSYVKREQVALEKTLNASKVKVEQFDGDRFSELRTSLVRCSRRLLASCHCSELEDDRGLKLWSLQFSDPMLTERTVSLMVFEVLCTVCQCCDILLKPEEDLQKKGAPKNKRRVQRTDAAASNGEYPKAIVDYALAYKDVVFGVVEVKIPSKMTAAALVQLLLSLLKLQNEYRQEKMQYVGILTDGFRYVLVRLEGEKFTFENKNYGIADHPKLRIHKAIKWIDLSALCGDIQSVFRSATARLEELAKR